MTNKTMMRSVSHRTNAQKIADDERELQELIDQANGKTTEETSGEGSVEEASETEEVPKETGETTEVTAEEGTKESVDPAPEVGDESLSSEEKSFKKRYGDLRKHLAAKEKEFQDRLAELESNPSVVVPPKSDEDLDKWMTEHPDVASIVMTIADKQAKKLFDQTQDKFKSLDELTSATQVAKTEQAIRDKHPDYDTLKGDDKFHDWLEKQPTVLQNAIYESTDDSASAIRVIDLYKMDNDLTPVAKKKKAADAALAVDTKSKPKVSEDDTVVKFTESQVAQMDDKTFEKNLEAITKAQREGNFVYDMTG